MMEDIDKTIFTNVTPLVFATLIDRKPDSRNHVSHVVITKAQRADLLLPRPC